MKQVTKAPWRELCLVPHGVNLGILGGCGGWPQAGFSGVAVEGLFGLDSWWSSWGDVGGILGFGGALGVILGDLRGIILGRRGNVGGSWGGGCWRVFFFREGFGRRVAVLLMGSEDSPLLVVYGLSLYVLSRHSCPSLLSSQPVALK